MQFKNIILVAAAALSSTAAADFVVLTGIPTPTNLAVLANLASYISSLENYVTSELGQLTASIGPSGISKAASVHTALASFVATASYSIPSEVTKLGALETFTTVPAWYSALPSDVKSYYDANNARVQSLVDQAVLGSAANATSTSKIATGTAAVTTKSTATGAASEKIVGLVGAGFAAAFAGVMAL